jgi:hypothetical protein
LYCFVGNTWNRSQILAHYCAIPTKGPIHMLVCLPLPPTPPCRHRMMACKEHTK